MNQGNFFSELKRRNVYKVAVAYAVIAWLLIQGTSILFPTFEAPAWVMKVFVVVLAAGFVVALFIAWAFEMTPQGMKRTETSGPTKEGRQKGQSVILAVRSTRAARFQMFKFTDCPPAPSSQKSGSSGNSAKGGGRSRA